MTVTALVSAKSCGVTASGLALTLASRRTSLLAECDPAGGTVRAGLLSSIPTRGVGLYHLAEAERTSPEVFAQAVPSHLVGLDEAGHRKVLPGMTDPTQAAALTRTWPALSQVLHILAADADYDVYIDAGRLAVDAGRLHPTLSCAPLIYEADLVLLTVRGTEQSLALARHLIRPLRAELDAHGSGAEALGVLLIEGGYRAHQVSDALGVPVLAALPWDPATAGYLTEGGTPPRGYGGRRSPLLHRARSATEQIEAVAQRRRVQRHWPRPDHPQMAGVLDRLTAQAAEGGV